jgi:hypothetical protein
MPRRIADFRVIFLERFNWDKFSAIILCGWSNFQDFKHPKVDFRAFVAKVEK